MKRRIEITRERWTRLVVQPSTAQLCSRCGSIPELKSFAEAADAAAVDVERIARAINRGELAKWKASNGPLVCLRCVQLLFDQKT
jgi:hypothetical protein